MYIVLATCVLFIITTVIVSYISYRAYRNSFYEYSNDLVLSGNAQAAYIIDGDLVEHYAKTLTVDEAYESFAALLDGLREQMNVAYFYILTDTGVPGMYTYIYDGAHDEANPGAHYALGETEAKDVYEGAAEVLATGKGFDHALYYNDYYGELYYAYSPVTNSEGEVVAFVGTDIDIQPLHGEIRTYSLTLLFTVLGAIMVFIAVSVLIVRNLLTLPMRNITENALRISQGDLDLELSAAVKRQSSEISQLGAAFGSLTQSVSKMIDDIDHIMMAARNGYLGERIDQSKYRGDYFRIVSGVNAMLDVMCQHFDAIPDAIAFFGMDGKLHHYNLGMANVVYRHKLDPYQPTFLTSLIAQDGQHTEKEEAQAVLRDLNRQVYQRDITLSSPQGTDESSSYTLSLLQIHSATVDHLGGSQSEACVLLLLNDVTTLSQARNAAILASRAKGDFLSRMSHEIRTPMNAIIGLSQVASGSEDMAKIKTCLTKIEESSDHLLGIINDILDFSKVEAGKLVLETSLFSLQDDLAFVLEMMASRAREREIEITYNAVNIVHDGIYADSLRLNQVLINLLTNAIKFSHTGGTIAFTVEECGFDGETAQYRFAVKDQGIGIEPARAAKLFERFEQADASVTRRYGGTGLGLAISKSIVEQMHGAIEVQSELGEGSTFTFEVAVKAQVAAMRAEEGEASPQQDAVWDFSAKRALIVDDIEINREIIAELMAESGLKMEMAEDGQQAVEMIANSPEHYYDLVLMDMQMPRMDGCTATREIRTLPRQDAAGIIIIAMTANVMQDDIRRALDSGMNDHLGKPVDVHAMRTMMGKYLHVTPTKR